MTRPSWSTHELAEFVAAVSECGDAADAMRCAVERAAEAMDADFGLVAAEGAPSASIGFPAGVDPGPELAALARRDPAAPVTVPSVPWRCVIASAPVDEGMLMLGRDAAEPFSGEEHSLVRAMGRVLALGLRTIRTVAQLQERQDLLERLSTIQRSITRRADLQETLDAIVAGAADLVEEPIAALRLVDERDPEWALMVSSVGVPGEIKGATRRSRLALGAGGRAISEERLIVIDDYESAEGIIRPFVGHDVQCAMAAPVREQGRVVGSLTVATRTAGRRFSAAEQELLLSYAEHASLALTDARMVENAVHQAMHDTLTGLPNRALFMDRIRHALATARRRGLAVAVLFLDLDHFKVVNDSLGHQAGDELLMAVAARLSLALRRSDTIARFGGDEFGILVEDVVCEQDAVQVAEAIAALFVKPFPLQGRDHFVSASIGIVISGAGAAPDPMIRNADAAMYRAKAAGRGRYELFDEVMRARAVQRLRVESELRTALDREELRLLYQPVVSLVDGALRAAEALVRWEHPERGTLSPDEFIGVAEESGLIVRLGQWVLQRACLDAAGWARARPDGPQLAVSVNLSVRQVADARLSAVVEEALAASGLDPALLALEVTETVLLEDADGPKETLRAIKDLGVRLLLDDFGTGYSSLGYLKRLPLDGLKIDRQFVDGLAEDGDDAAIVSAVTGMARGLGLTVIAEGVETAAQAAELRRLGCQRAQGFLFSPPLPAQAVCELGAGTMPAPWSSPRPRSIR